MPSTPCANEYQNTSKKFTTIMNFEMELGKWSRSFAPNAFCQKKGRFS
jgi:hypothetical protein